MIGIILEFQRVTILGIFINEIVTDVTKYTFKKREKGEYYE